MSAYSIVANVRGLKTVANPDNKSAKKLAQMYFQETGKWRIKKFGYYEPDYVKWLENKLSCHCF